MESQTPPSNPPQPTAPEPAAVPSSSPPPPAAQPVLQPAPQSAPLPPGHKSKVWLTIIGFIIVMIGFAILALWYYQSQQKQAASAVALNPQPSVAGTEQKLVVGTDPTYPPMESLENNKLTGYDIDLANFIGKELGAEIEFRQIVFDDLFTALEKKEIDMIISTVTVTDERKQKYDFSEPYLQGGQVLLTKKDNSAIITTTDLKGKKVGVQKGTTMEAEALKYTTDNMVIRFPDSVQATAALVKGDVDAISADLPGAKGITIANPTLKIAGDPFTQEYYAIVFRKGDPSIGEINKALSSLKVKGILADLKQQWLDN